MFSFLRKIFGKTSSDNQNQTKKKNAVPANREDIDLAIECIDWITSTMSETDNWRVGFSRMKSYIIDYPNSYGMSMARDSWEAMQGGYGSWSDYYIPHEDFETQKKLNEELQSYCSALVSALSAYSLE